jgi:hypothetical protein
MVLGQAGKAATGRLKECLLIVPVQCSVPVCSALCDTHSNAFGSILQKFSTGRYISSEASRNSSRVSPPWIKIWLHCTALHCTAALHCKGFPQLLQEIIFQSGPLQPELSTVQYSTVQPEFSTVQCSYSHSAVRCSAVHCSAVQCSYRHSAVQCSAVQCSAVQCSAVQCSAVQCSAVQSSAVLLQS